MPQARDLADFVRMSARIGSERSLVQGPGGNTSLKDGDRLWVKASGRWLADACTQDVFVELSLSQVRARIAAGDADDFSTCVVSGQDHQDLKPSIETAFHALLPHTVVIHAHAFNAMAVSVMCDGEPYLHRKLATDVHAAWIPYHRPGAPLAKAFADVLALGGPPSVLLLQNHGIVVGAEDVASAEQLLRAIEEQLSLPERCWPGFDPARAEAHATQDYRSDAINGDLAFDPFVLEVAGRFPLIPDQVVFTGGAICIADPGEGLHASAAGVEAATGIWPVLVLVPGIGAFRRSGRSGAADSIINGLVAILRRLPPGSGIQGLSGSETAELLGWDAEHYRQRLGWMRG